MVTPNYATSGNGSDRSRGTKYIKTNDGGVIDALLRSLADALNAVDKGPGRWRLANESMPIDSATYQMQITKQDMGLAFDVNGVKFDGYANGILQDAKGTGYAGQMKYAYMQNRLIQDAAKQVVAADGTPIQWSMAERSAAQDVARLFADNGIPIDVVYAPPAG